jgi:hypothetical protein
MSGTQFLSAPNFQPVDITTVATSTAATGLTAVGTTRANALQLTARVNNITTAAAGTGVVLPLGVPGTRITLFNNGVSNIQVYGAGADTIDGVAAATGVVLTAGATAGRCEYFCVAPGVILSAKLGVVSA